MNSRKRKKYNKPYSKNIFVDISSLDAPRKFNQEIWHRVRKDILDITIEFNSAHKTFPNICLLIAGIIDYYREQRVNFNFQDRNNTDGYITNTHFQAPCNADIKSDLLNYPFDKVWTFSTPEGISNLTDTFVDKIRTSEVVEEGVLRGITWCINEAMDNVLQHANISKGLIMGQHLKDSHRIAISIFDYGRGILKSFKDSNYYKPRTAKDAITLALQEKVTRDPNVGQGNGMWGLSELVFNNGGLLRIISSKAGIQFNSRDVSDIPLSQCIYLGFENACTLVDFQLDYLSAIDIDRILGGMVDLWMENHETDAGKISFSLAQEANGTGTRQAAERLRNMILNAYNEKKCKIIIDFEGINFLSSSFADELLGKLLVKFGLINFMLIFELVNISSSNKVVINRSVQQRMAQMYYDETISLPKD